MCGLGRKFLLLEKLGDDHDITFKLDGLFFATATRSRLIRWWRLFHPLLECDVSISYPVHTGTNGLKIFLPMVIKVNLSLRVFIFSWLNTTIIQDMIRGNPDRALLVPRRHPLGKHCEQNVPIKIREAANLFPQGLKIQFRRRSPLNLCALFLLAIEIGWHVLALEPPLSTTLSITIGRKNPLDG